jgi:hypothetical protein
MTDLESIRAAAVPRDRALCGRMAARIDPAWGFVAYGLLYFFVATAVSMAAFLWLLWTASSMGLPRAPWVATASLVVYTLLYVACWLPFAVWVSRRRGAARRLFRQGTLFEAVITRVDLIVVRGAPLTRASLAFDVSGVTRSAVASVGGHSPELVPGAKLPVLHVPDYGYCVAFAPSGVAVPASI